MGSPPWLLAFRLARACRCREPGLDAIGAIDLLGTLVDLDRPWWWILGFHGADDAEERLIDAWGRVLFLEGTFEDAIRHGLANPALLPRRLSRPRTLPALVSALVELQLVGAPRPVVLSQSAFANALAVEQSTVSRWADRLRREGVLQLVADYWHPKKPESGLDEDRRRRATTYWVDVVRVDALATEARRECEAAAAGGAPAGGDNEGADGDGSRS